MKEYWLAIRTSSTAAPVCFPLTKGATTIGRGELCDIVIPEKKVSRLHLAIIRKGDDFFVEDRRKSARRKESPLPVGETIRLHKAELTLCATLTNLVKEPGKNEKGPEWANFTAFISSLRRSTDTRSLLEKLLSGLVSLLKAERGYVLLKKEGQELLTPVAFHLDGDIDELIKISSTIYNEVLQSKSALFVKNTKTSQICHEALSLKDGGPRTVLCCPLLSLRKLVGVVYLDRAALNEPYTNNQVNLVESACGLASGLLAEGATRRRLLEASNRLKAIRRLVEDSTDFISGKGEAGAELERLIDAASKQDVSVLITGETGTGKEMVARELHLRSERANGPFIAVNCAALPFDLMESELFGHEKGAFTGADVDRLGRFELASGGTIFLDEVGELPMSVQVKLLRVLQERVVTRLGTTEDIPVDFRLLCATNRLLEEAVAKGAFRKDLFYRINVFPIPLAPLRERKEEIIPLALHFLQRIGQNLGSKVKQLSAKAEKVLLHHSWPGNIRELHNAIERAVVVERGSSIKADSLPLSSALMANTQDCAQLLTSLPSQYKEAKEAFERAFLTRAIDDAKGNITAAAKATGMTRYTIYRRMEKLGMNPAKE